MVCFKWDTKENWHKPREDVKITAADLLRIPEGTITESGLRNNVSAALRYIAAWLNGNGCVPIHNLMEDAATAEIARAQIWQWIRYPKGIFDDGRKVTTQLLDTAIAEELDQIHDELGQEAFEQGQYKIAADLFRKLSTSDEFQEFLTLEAYEFLN